MPQSDPVSAHVTGQELPSEPAAPDATPSEAPPTPVPAAPVRKLAESARVALEAQIVNREVTVRVQGKPLILKKWGLQKKLGLGSRVINLTDLISKAFPNLLEQPEQEVQSSQAVAILSHVSSFIIELIAASLVQPFKTLAEAEEWLDENCDLTDLFNLAVVVYEQNFGTDGVGLKKYLKDLTSLTEKVVSHGLVLPK
jgi:hypothetical protein